MRKHGPGKQTPPSRAEARTAAGLHPNLHKVVSVICTPTTTYLFFISNNTDMTVSQVTDEVLYTGMIEMQEMDDSG